MSAEQGPGEPIPGIEQLIEGGGHMRVPYRQRPGRGIVAVSRGAGALACGIFRGIDSGAAQQHKRDPTPQQARRPSVAGGRADWGRSRSAGPGLADVLCRAREF